MCIRRLSVLAAGIGAMILEAAAPAFAGAFLAPEGEGQVIVTTTFSDARKAYDAKGRLIRTPAYRKFEAQAYAEYGVADWLTLVAEGNYFSFKGAAPATQYLNLLTAEALAGAPLTPSRPPGPHFDGLGLGGIGARVRLYEIGGFILSAEATFRAAEPLARRYLDIANGRQFDARLQLGRSFTLLGLPAFVDAQLGYRSAGQNGGEIRADMTYGLRPFADILLLAQFFSAVAPGARTATTFVASQKIAGSVVYDLTQRISLQIGAVAVPAGTNWPAERGAFSAVWLRF